jgi:hypothetical protein
MEGHPLVKRNLRRLRCWGRWRSHDDRLHVAALKALQIGEDSQ